MLQTLVLQRSSQVLSSRKSTDRPQEKSKERSKERSSARIINQHQKQRNNLLFSSTSQSSGAYNSKETSLLLTRSQTSHHKVSKASETNRSNLKNSGRESSKNRMLILDDNRSIERKGDEDMSIQLIKRNYYKPTSILMSKSQSVRQMKDRSSSSARKEIGFYRSTSQSSRNQSQTHRCDSVILQKQGRMKQSRDSSVKQMKKSHEHSQNLRLSQNSCSSLKFDWVDQENNSATPHFQTQTQQQLPH